MTKRFLLACLMMLVLAVPVMARERIFLRGDSDDNASLMVFVIAHYLDREQVSLENATLDLLNDKLQNGDLSDVRVLSKRVRTLNVDHRSQQNEEILRALGISETMMPCICLVSVVDGDQPTRVVWRSGLSSPAEQVNELSEYVEEHYSDRPHYNDSLIRSADIASDARRDTYSSGDDLDIVVQGAPDAAVSAEISDLTSFTCKEESAGVYRGSYRVGDNDWGMHVVRVTVTRNGRRETRQIGKIRLYSANRGDSRFDEERGQVTGVTQVGATDWMFRGYAEPNSEVKLHVEFLRQLLFIKDVERYDFGGYTDSYGQYQIVGHLRSDVDGEYANIKMTVFPRSGEEYESTFRVKCTSDWRYRTDD